VRYIDMGHKAKAEAWSKENKACPREAPMTVEQVNESIEQAISARRARGLHRSKGDTQMATYDISSYTPLKAGTRIVARSLPLGAADWVYNQTGTIARWTREMGPRNGLPAGYEPVRFDDGTGVLMVHSSGFKVA
jgi:hypothetical protein